MIHTLAIDSVELNFGEREILQGAYVAVRTGEVVGLLGRNGSGKSRLMRIIYGTLACRYRTLKIDDVYTTRAYRRPGLIRYAPQFAWLPAGARVERVFADFGIDFEAFLRDFPELARIRAQKVGQLSGGERRIVEIYLVLVSPVRFALLDEPFSQVMPLHIRRIKDLILRGKSNKGITLTDHMYRHILDLSERVYVLAEKKFERRQTRRGFAAGGVCEVVHILSHPRFPLLSNKKLTLRHKEKPWQKANSKNTPSGTGGSAAVNCMISRPLPASTSRRRSSRSGS